MTNSTTKIKPVFDASACKRGYPILNQYLEKGPNLIELVPSSLNKFREREIRVVSDIKKAYLFLDLSISVPFCFLPSARTFVSKTIMRTGGFELRG